MNALETEDLRVQFGEHRALDAVTISIPEGSFTAMMGPNGAGKSTLLLTALGLLKPDAGSISVFGAPPRHTPPESIGYVPQVKTMDRTFPALAIELVVTGLRWRWPWRIRAAERDLAVAMLARVGAEHLAYRPIGRLSGGETQRVYLARSLVRHPKLILLDEPTAGMDVSGEADMFHILETYQRESGATVVMITHDWDCARHHASHLLLLNRRVVAFGKPAEVMGGESFARAFGHAGHAHSHTHPPEGRP